MSHQFWRLGAAARSATLVAVKQTLSNGRLTPTEVLAIEATVCLSEALIYLRLLDEVPEILDGEELLVCRTAVEHALRVTRSLAPAHAFAA